ncbi:MAG: DUF4384 domain-containing protein [Spirochaetia bacterium]|nr:DUF4384 domain-containing protein [Spirochaetia bacterium]
MRGKKLAMVVIATMIITHHLWGIDEINGKLKQAVDALAREAGLHENADQQQNSDPRSKINRGRVVVVGTITYANTGIGSEFSAYIGEKLRDSLRDHDHFLVSDNRNLDKIMEQMKLAISGFTDKSQGPEIGKLRTATTLLEGTYYDMGTEIEVELELTEVESGLSVAGTRFSLHKEHIHVDLSLLPENYANAQEVLEELSNMMAESTEGLSIFAWSDRGNGATYKGDENLVIHFFANRACFIKLYHIDVHKKTSLIFPNEYYSDNRIEAGQVYAIPDEHYPFRFVLGAPYGTEFIKIVASTRQFYEIEEAFRNIGTASAKILTRGLAVQQKNELRAEEMISYTILE